MPLRGSTRKGTEGSADTCSLEGLDCVNSTTLIIYFQYGQIRFNFHYLILRGIATIYIECVISRSFV